MTLPKTIAQRESPSTGPLAPARHEELEAFVRCAPWTQGLPESTLAAVMASASVRDFAPGEILCRQGDAPTHWFGIMHGLVRVDMLCADGEITSVTAGPVGTWFGEASLLVSERRIYETSALRRARIACIGAETFRRIHREDPLFNATIARMLAERLLYFMGMFADQRRVDIDRRIARILLTLVPRSEAPARTNIDITHDELAALAGVSRQRAGRALQTLQADGLIETAYSSVRILDVIELQSAC